MAPVLGQVVAKDRERAQVITDGALTIGNLCAEAGISRASYYRSPAAAVIREVLSSGPAARPETGILRAQARELKKAEKRLRRDHSAQVRELTDTVTAYANRIQVLALRNAELKEHNPMQLSAGLEPLPGVSRMGRWLVFRRALAADRASCPVRLLERKAAKDRLPVL